MDRDLLELQISDALNQTKAYEKLIEIAEEHGITLHQDDTLFYEIEEYITKKFINLKLGI